MRDGQIPWLGFSLSPAGFLICGKYPNKYKNNDYPDPIAVFKEIAKTITHCISPHLVFNIIICRMGNSVTDI